MQIEKIKEWIGLKESELNYINRLQKEYKNKFKLDDLDKNEIEVKAQLQLLRLILDEEE